MKTCPLCQHPLNFVQFVTGYGSDTLFKHPAQAHPHEHRCLSCHQAIWIHYDRAFFEKRFRQSLLLHLVFSAALIFLGVQPALGFSQLQAALFMVLVMIFGGVLIRAYARYESASLKAERAAPRD